MRDASTTIPPTSIWWQVPNPNPACDTSSAVTEASTSLARGPHSPIVVQAEARSAREARGPGGAPPPLGVGPPAPPPGPPPDPARAQPHDGRAGANPAVLVEP